MAAALSFLMDATVIGGQCHRTFNTPLSGDSSMKSGNRNTRNLTPFSEWASFAIPRQFSGNGSIARLGYGQRPIHITSLVMTIVIYAIQGMLDGRALTHFGKKVIKRLKAKLNSAFTVAVVLSVVRIVATLTSFDICLVFRRMLSTFSRPVLVAPFSGDFRMQAPTRLGGVGLEQIARCNHTLVTALTQALPVMSIVVRASGVGFNNQSTDLTTNKIDKTGIGRNRKFANFHKYSLA